MVICLCRGNVILLVLYQIFIPYLQAHKPQHWPALTYVDKVRRRKRDLEGFPEQSGSHFERRGRMDDRQDEDSSKVDMTRNVDQVLGILGAIYNFKYKNG